MKIPPFCRSSDGDASHGTLCQMGRRVTFGAVIEFESLAESNAIAASRTSSSQGADLLNTFAGSAPQPNFA